MKLVGLGGGIGAGKSAVSTRFAQLGAVIVDADLVAREVVEPGRPALATIVERFGVDVVAEGGTLNRAALAGIVFSDPDALQDLNAITHPAIAAAMAHQIADFRNTDRTVIVDAALRFESLRVGMVGQIVVDVSPEIAVDRLVRFRGFTEVDAWARVGNQMSREERCSTADFVIDNSGDEVALDAQVQRAWTWIGTLSDDRTTQSDPIDPSILSEAIRRMD